jgi:hypothetical protein
MDRPLLLIDIDGVISLFGFDAQRPPSGRFVMVDGVAHFLSGAVAQRLRELGAVFDLAWCSGWEEKADEYLPHALGLPAGLPHLTFAPAGRELSRHWKLDAIDGFAGPQRSLAWIDDAHDQSCHEWAAAREASTVLVTTEPGIGLTEDQAAELRAWAIALRR